MPPFEPALYRGFPVESILSRTIRFPHPKGKKINEDLYKLEYSWNSNQTVNNFVFK